MNKTCEYRLPCGRCNKFNIFCDLSYADIKFMSEMDKINEAETTSETLREECEHEWRLSKTSYDEKSRSAVNYYICSKCGETKTLSLGF